MSASNLAIVFGPTLFGQQQGVQVDTALQNKASLPVPLQLAAYLISLQAIETILEHYADIFVDDAEL
jgi:hypothetical protein